MTILECVAKFTKLTCFEDDYVATDMAKVRKFEDGLKLSIQGKIVGFLLGRLGLYGQDGYGHRQRERDK